MSYGSLIAVSIIFLLCTVLYWCLDGLRYDDSFIFLRIARNMLDGHGPVWNVGDQYTNTTSALWPTLIALGGLIAGPDDLPFVSKILSYISLAGASLALYAVIRKSSHRELAWVAPFAVFLPAHHFILCGMESELAVFAILAATALYMYGFSLYWVAVALAASYLARPDTVIFAGLLYADYLFFGRGMRQRLMQSVAPSLFCLGLCLVWHVYLYTTTGTVLPTTLHTKVIQGTSGTYWVPFGQEIMPYLCETIAGRPFMIGFALVGLAVLFAIAPIIPLWALLHLAAYASVGIAAYPWYYYPLFFVTCLCAFLGIARIAAWALAWADRLRPGRMLARAVVLAGAAAFMVAAIDTQTGVRARDLPRWISTLRLHGRYDLHINPRDVYVDSRRQAHDQVADWIIANRSQLKGATILTDEIGVIGYRLPDWRVVDEVGMTDPQFAVAFIHNWQHYVATERPVFILRNYIADQPDMMAFPIVGAEKAIYQKIFAADGGFVADLYERRSVADSAQR